MQLGELETELPNLAKVLDHASRNRRKSIITFRSGARFKGLDQWLKYLVELETAFSRVEQLSKLHVLVVRIRCNYEVATEAALSGANSVVFDLMRDVMETWLLLRDFVAEPGHAEEWLSASDELVRKRYQPAQLRQREADRTGVRVTDLLESRDYKMHSRALHVSPTRFPWERRGFRDETFDEFAADMCYWEIFSHAKSILAIMPRLIETFVPEKDRPSVGHDLPLVDDAYERVMQMLHMFLALHSLRDRSGNPP